MGSFNRDNNRGGGNRNFGRRDFGGRNSDGPRQMFRATCSNCGKECEVPFRPTNGKPVFCSECFENNGGSQDSRSMGNSRNFDRPSFGEEKRMFSAVCDNCGKNCEVPFQPRGDKPVYCSNCFENNGNANPRTSDRGEKRTNSANSESYKKDFEALNLKLDTILKMLTPVKAETKQKTPVIIFDEVDKTETKSKVSKISKKKVSPKKKSSAKKK